MYMLLDSADLSDQSITLGPQFCFVVVEFEMCQEIIVPVLI